jgi:hypothetical protein
MALSNFKPTLWTGVLMRELEKNLVYGQPAITNRNYQGQIEQKGDSVRIVNVGRVTVSKGAGNVTYQDVVDSATNLVIDQEAKWGVKISDIDQVQADAEVLTTVSQEAAYALQDTIDQEVAALMKTAVESVTANLVGTTASPKTDLGTAGNPYKYITQLKAKLSAAKVPNQGRYLIVPPWFLALLLQDDRFTKTGSQQAEERLANGLMGRIVGFDVYESQNVPTSSTTNYIIAGVPTATTMALQLAKTETLRDQNDFRDLVRGLALYGYKVTHPSRLACLIGNEA